MSKENSGRHGLTISFSGLWIVGWPSSSPTKSLFTIGLADLSFGRELLALLLWPYYVGSAIGAMQ